METGAALLLGVVQGLTEFLPVSSSGHLVLSRALLPEGALSSPGVLFEAVVHLGTLAAAMIFLRREVGCLLRALLPAGAETPESVRAGRRLIGLLLLATIPAAALGAAFAGPIRAAFSGTESAAAGLVLTGGALLGLRPRAGTKAEARGTRGSIPPPPKRARDALVIGFAQALALLPGVSRSGLTILAAQARGLTGGDAARFSFLLSGPVIAGAAALETVTALSGEGLGASASGIVAIELAVGFVAAFGSGTLALRWVFGWLARKRFHQFGWYCLCAGGIGLGLSSA